ncbi:MAG: HEAT repeat domain-containing protein [Candidatus Omnitrophota bacterium]
MDNKKILQDLLNMLKDVNPFSRKQAIKLLEKRGNKSVLPALIDVLLNDSDSIVRHAAAQAFQKKLADRSIGPALIKALKDPDMYVRGAAAAALGIIKDKTAVSELCLALEDKEAHVRWAAAIPLGKIGDASVIPALKKLLNNPGEPGNVRIAAKEALAQLENK